MHEQYTYQLFLDLNAKQAWNKHNHKARLNLKTIK